MDLFTLMLKTNPFYLLLVIPIFFVWIFFVLSFLIGLLNHYYVQIVKAHIKKITRKTPFMKVLEYFADKNGIVDYVLLDEFIEGFIHDPTAVDFGKYENHKKHTMQKEKLLMKDLKEKYCEITRQHPTLQSIQGLQ